jgi:chromosome partitioning protein
MNQNKISIPYIFVVGNEKGGAGKTTCSMHLIISLLHEGFRVSSIDSDCRQHSLTRYLDNRKEYNAKNPDHKVKMPNHFLLKESKNDIVSDRELSEKAYFEEVLEEAKKGADIIVIDTPGSHTYLSTLVHSYADTVITPINDSFIDIDVMAKVNSDNLEIIQPSIYSQMIWEQKMQRASRDRGSINWIVMRNRLSNLDAQNKRNVAAVLEKLAKRISFKQAPGFSERVIFRELFLFGLTLLDLGVANYGKGMNISHVAARQELREFLKCLGLDELKNAKNLEYA